MAYPRVTVAKALVRSRLGDAQPIRELDLEVRRERPSSILGACEEPPHCQRPIVLTKMIALNYEHTHHNMAELA
jgi:hypothetical protein